MSLGLLSGKDVKKEASLDSMYVLVGTGCFECQVCGYKSARSNMVKHVQRRHLQQRYTCALCGKVFRAEINRKEHLQRAHDLNLTLAEISGMKVDSGFIGQKAK